MAPPTDFSLKDFFVSVIESNRPEEWRGGFCEGQALNEVLKFSGIRCKLYMTSSKLELIQTLGSVAYEAVNISRWPMVHIAAHGFEDGIQLNSGPNPEVGTWRELSAMLAALHSVTNGLYFLCMSSCRGLAAVKLMFSNGQYPTVGVVGTLEKVNWNDSVIAFAVFYHLLKKGCTVQQACSAMRTASGHQNYSFVHGPSFAVMLSQHFQGQLVAKA